MPEHHPKVEPGDVVTIEAWSPSVVLDVDGERVEVVPLVELEREVGAWRVRSLEELRRKVRERGIDTRRLPLEEVDRDGR